MQTKIYATPAANLTEATRRELPAARMAVERLAQRADHVDAFADAIRQAEDLASSLKRLLGDAQGKAERAAALTDISEIWTRCAEVATLHLEKVRQG